MVAGMEEQEEEEGLRVVVVAVAVGGEGRTGKGGAVTGRARDAPATVIAGVVEVGAAAVAAAGEGVEATTGRVDRPRLPYRPPSRAAPVKAMAPVEEEEGEAEQ